MSTLDLIREAPIQHNRTDWAAPGQRREKILGTEILNNDLDTVARQLDAFAYYNNKFIVKVRRVQARGKDVVYGLMGEQP